MLLAIACLAILPVDVDAARRPTASPAADASTVAIRLIGAARHEEARAALAAALAALPPGSTRAIAAKLHNNLGNVIRVGRIGAPAEALAAYDAALALVPAHAQALNGKAIIVAEVLGHPEAATDLFRAAAAAAPGNGAVLENLAHALFGLGGRAAETEAAYRAVLARDPAHVAAATRLGIALRELFRPGEAVAAYAAAARLAEAASHATAAADAHNNRGNALARDLGRVAEAFGAFEAALVAVPAHAEARFNRGTTLLVDCYGHGHEGCARVTTNRDAFRVAAARDFAAAVAAAPAHGAARAALFRVVFWAGRRGAAHAPNLLAAVDGDEAAAAAAGLDPGGGGGGDPTAWAFHAKLAMMAGARESGRRRASEALAHRLAGALAAPGGPAARRAALAALGNAWAKAGWCGRLGLVLDDKLLLHGALRDFGGKDGEPVTAIAPRSFDLRRRGAAAAFAAHLRERRRAGAPKARWLARVAVAGDGKGTNFVPADADVGADADVAAAVEALAGRPLLLSEFVETPLTIDGFKAEFRLYALVERASGGGGGEGGNEGGGGDLLRVWRHRSFVDVKVATGADDTPFTNRHGHRARSAPPPALAAAVARAGGKDAWPAAWAEIGSVVMRTLAAGVAAAKAAAAAAGAPPPSCELSLLGIDMLLTLPRTLSRDSDGVVIGGGVSKIGVVVVEVNEQPGFGGFERQHGHGRAMSPEHEQDAADAAEAAAGFVADLFRWLQAKASEPGGATAATTQQLHGFELLETPHLKPLSSTPATGSFNNFWRSEPSPTMAKKQGGSKEETGPPRIPRRIIQTWKTRDALPDEMARCQARARELHPGWEYVFFDDAALDAFVRDRYPLLFYGVFGARNTVLRVQRLDLWRLLAVHALGGVPVKLFQNTSADRTHCIAHRRYGPESHSC